ncbi:MAG: MFS transporter, partial [Gammaproteobacteria bacterium]|nr:MFS transporter [Gammaproteobacteria bacterium]
MPDSIKLLKTRRFLPFFLTQLLGAFNDNLYKNGLTIFIAFQTANMT